jgi:hypothetical protein
MEPHNDYWSMDDSALELLAKKYCAARTPGFESKMFQRENTSNNEESRR